MAIKVVLRKKKNKNGTYPLALRITKNRVSSFIYLGHSIEEEHWDAAKERVKSAHKNAKRLNNLIIQKLADNNDQLLELEAQKKDTSSASIKKKLKAGSSSSFIQQSDVYIKGLVASGKFNRESADNRGLSDLRSSSKTTK